MDLRLYSIRRTRMGSPIMRRYFPTRPRLLWRRLCSSWPLQRFVYVVYTQSQSWIITTFYYLQSMQLQMEPQSSETIPASSQNSVKQKIHVKNPNNVRLSYAYRRIKLCNIIVNSYILTGGSEIKVQSDICPTWS